jgi:hypothetical protein
MTNFSSSDTTCRSAFELGYAGAWWKRRPGFKIQVTRRIEIEIEILRAVVFPRHPSQIDFIHRSSILYISPLTSLLPKYAFLWLQPGLFWYSSSSKILPHSQVTQFFRSFTALLHIWMASGSKGRPPLFCHHFLLTNLCDISLHVPRCKLCQRCQNLP